jgi:hypothetical protein
MRARHQVSHGDPTCKRVLDSLSVFSLHFAKILGGSGGGSIETRVDELGPIVEECRGR